MNPSALRQALATFHREQDALAAAYERMFAAAGMRTSQVQALRDLESMSRGAPKEFLRMLKVLRAKNPRLSDLR